MMEERIVEVSKDWYAELATYLRPGERWTKEDELPSLVLYASAGVGHSATKLVFVPDKESE